MIQATDTDFQNQIGQKGVTLVEFGATWCPPCKTLLPILEEISHELEGQVNVIQLDVDESPAVTAAYGVMSMPTVILFKDGQPMEKLVGLRSKMTYLNLLNKLLS